ncbi:transposase [Vibrio harveyi]|uniref:transposase n=1 Tax=Vibrio harveyi TaxID=669 RepID=UPI0018F1C898|nr:transposase [Vibrio harveyi]
MSSEIKFNKIAPAQDRASRVHVVMDAVKGTVVIAPTMQDLSETIGCSMGVISELLRGKRKMFKNRWYSPLHYTPVLDPESYKHKNDPKCSKYVERRTKAIEEVLAGKSLIKEVARKYDLNANSLQRWASTERKARELAAEIRGEN